MAGNTARRRGTGRPSPDGASPVPPDVLADPAATAAAYVAHISRTGLSPATVRAYGSHVRGFAAWLAGRAEHAPGEVFTDPYSRDFATRDFRAHLSLERRLRPSTVDANLAALDSMFVWLGVGKSTTARVNAADDGFGRHLDERESRAVLRAAERRGARDLAMIGVMRFCGARIGEVSALNVDDLWISERKGEIELHGKGGKVRKVPVGSSARESLQPWLLARRTHRGADGPALFLSSTGERIAVRSIRNVVARVGESAGVPDLYPHQLRHTFARRLLAAGVPPTEVQRFLGHVSLETTVRYTKPSQEEYIAAIEKGDEAW